MKKLLFLFIALFAYIIPARCQAKIKSIKKVADGLYIMYYDTTHIKRIVTKSIIVEFKNYIALLEMPISNNGAGAVDLKDHSAGGETVLQALKEYFPHKPLKYVLSTHWHPHSISSILPFVSRGITVITTRKNFTRLSEFVDSAAYNKYKQFIWFVTDSGLTIKDKKNSIVIYKLDREDYPHLPTEDFLFFYLPKYKLLHNSCMFQRFVGSNVTGKELVSTRVEDLDAFITSKHLRPAYLATTDTYWDEADGLVSGDTLRAMMQKGITMTALQNEILRISETTLMTKTDSVLRYLMDNHIPYSILNMAVYDRLRNNDLSKALAIARIQALIGPSDPNVWDTYGEVYYFMGETKMAKKYELQSKRIDKNFTWGGEQVWKKEKEEMQKQSSKK